MTDQLAAPIRQLIQTTKADLNIPEATDEELLIAMGADCICAVIQTRFLWLIEQNTRPA